MFDLSTRLSPSHDEAVSEQLCDLEAQPSMLHRLKGSVSLSGAVYHSKVLILAPSISLAHIAERPTHLRLRWIPLGRGYRLQLERGDI